MKVMITGSGGQLGRDVAIHMQVAGHEVHGFDRRRLDITNMQCVQSVVLKTKPDVIIHAAAYTAVDDAERDLEKAYLVNAIGTRNVVLAAEAVAAKLVYISTDYVFDGEKGSPYLEYDTPNPINRYGYSKRAGELLVQSLCSRWFIVRVSWLYGAYGNNFVKTMLALASVKEKIQVVDDQHGSPTYTVDVARFLIELIQSTRYGIYHATNGGSCTWYELAKEIFVEKGIDVRIDPISTEQYPRPARRPRYSVLERVSLRMEGFTPMRHWRAALRDCLRTLG